MKYLWYLSIEELSQKFVSVIVVNRLMSTQIPFYKIFLQSNFVYLRFIKIWKLGLRLRSFNNSKGYLLRFGADKY